METYTPDNTKIVHNTKTDFSRRTVNRPIYIVQYDNGLPVIAVSLYLDGKAYVLPGSVHVNIRVGKQDGTFVYNEVLGCNIDRNIVYFEVTLQMTTARGIIKPVLEICTDDDGVANTGCIEIEIERNPIQEGDIESSTEYTTVKDYTIRAENASNSSEQFAKDSESSASNSESSASYASISKADAASSASEASSSASVAMSSAASAESSASEASSRATEASSSASVASTSSLSASSSASNASTSASEALTSKTSAASSASSAASSASDSASSANSASASATSAYTAKNDAETYKNLSNEIYQSILLSDIGELESSLYDYGAIFRPIYDSNGDNITDSSEEILVGQKTLASADMVLSLQYKVSLLEAILYNFMKTISPERLAELELQVLESYSTIDRVTSLEEHALLDSSY